MRAFFLKDSVTLKAKIISIVSEHEPIDMNEILELCNKGGKKYHLSDIRELVQPMILTGKFQYSKGLKIKKGRWYSEEIMETLKTISSVENEIINISLEEAQFKMLSKYNMFIVPVNENTILSCDMNLRRITVQLNDKNLIEKVLGIG